MPALPQIALGFAPAAGADALGQARHFKGLMRNEIGSVDGAWLEHVTDAGRVGLVVRYDPSVKGAAEWASRAEAWKDNVWLRVESAAERVRGRA